MRSARIIVHLKSGTVLQSTWDLIEETSDGDHGFAMAILSNDGIWFNQGEGNMAIVATENIDYIERIME